MSDQANHIAQWFKTWWFLIVFSLSLLGGLVTMWFQLQFVIAAVNPASLAEYGVEQAVLGQKRKIRWCLGKMLIEEEVPTKRQILECAD